MKLLKVIMVCAGVSLSAQANESEIPEPFRGSTESSPIEIDYSDWSLVLRNTVIGAKRSSRGRGANSIQEAPTGSRISRRNTRDTRNEGNRINFRELSTPANVEMLTNIRTSLEQVPTDAPLKLWRKQEQLAYWLNLYNVTLIEQLAKKYPQRKIGRKKDKKDSIWNQKLLTVAGVSLSLNDIQHTILPNKWDGQLIIYGLYQGYIGGPSIQKTAFTSKNIDALLTASARDFVNSNRGAKASGKTLKIAKFYKENTAFFPNGDSDLKTHLVENANRNSKDAYANTSKIKFLKTDHYTTDIYAGGKDIGTAQSNNVAALTFATVTGDDTFGSGPGEVSAVNGATSLLDRLRDITDGEHMNVGIPESMREYIINMRREELKREGEVRIEQVDKKSPDQQ